MENKETRGTEREWSQKDTVEKAEETQGDRDTSKAIRQGRVEAKQYDVRDLEKASTTDLPVPPK